MGSIDRSNLFVSEMCAINMAAFQIFGSLVAFFLPLVIMFVMYTLTVRTLNRQARLVSNIMVQSGRNSSFADLHSSRRYERANSTATNRSDYEIESDRESTSPLNRRCSACRRYEKKQTTTRSWRKAMRPLRWVLGRLRRLKLLARRTDGDDVRSKTATDESERENSRCSIFVHADAMSMISRLHDA